jgi:hypothetical protein
MVFVNSVSPHCFSLTYVEVLCNEAGYNLSFYILLLLPATAGIP